MQSCSLPWAYCPIRLKISGVASHHQIELRQIFIYIGSCRLVSCSTLKQMPYSQNVRYQAFWHREVTQFYMQHFASRQFERFPLSLRWVECKTGWGWMEHGDEPYLSQLHLFPLDRNVYLYPNSFPDKLKYRLKISFHFVRSYSNKTSVSAPPLSSDNLYLMGNSISIILGNWSIFFIGSRQYTYSRSVSNNKDSPCNKLTYSWCFHIAW